MKDFFDYMFFRLFHLNSGKGKIQGFPAILVISVVQTLYLAGIGMMIIQAVVDAADIKTYYRLITLVICGLYISLMMINGIMYNKRQVQILEKWQSETSHRFLKDIGIVLVILFSPSPFIISHYLYN